MSLTAPASSGMAMASPGEGEMRNMGQQATEVAAGGWSGASSQTLPVVIES